MKKTGKKKSALYIETADPSWRQVSGLRSRLEKAAALTIARLPESLQAAARRAEFTLLLTSDAAVRRLNHDFRGLNKPTNVLSFPHFTRAQLVRSGKGREDVYVGDIAVAYQYAVDEARKENKIFVHHVTHLLIHGLLHLFGYDHHTAAAAARMERQEKKLMAELGLPDPYAPVPLKTPRARNKKRRRT
ncbi:MAG: rRNA maturation RNase YbeY [Alphaproteobacteria bacterium]|nr:rRNA maturation RNase YbeY [Alphaproteobacteria bacterium]